MMPSEAGLRLLRSARLNESDTRSNLIDPAIHERGWKVPDLISSPGMLANYTPVQDWSDGEGWSFLQGSCEGVDDDNPHHEKQATASRTPLDTNRVLYLNLEQESVVLDPYIVLERCSSLDSSLWIRHTVSLVLL